jgi:hypothetical protein
MKLLALAVIALIPCSAAVAQTYNPFDSDGCVPGYTAAGQFVDQAGKVLDSAGWVVTSDNKVLTADGRPVYLDESCVGKLAKTGVGGTGIAIGLGLAAAALAAGSSSSTSGTN